PESYADLLKKDQPNPSPFRPGLSATVDIHTQRDTGLSVPIQAVTTREPTPTDTAANAGPNRNTAGVAGTPKMKEYVFVYNNGGAVKQVAVTTGIQDDTYIRILSGLNEG